MSFPINISFKGKTIAIQNVTVTTTTKELQDLILDALNDNTLNVKLLFKGKRLPVEEEPTKIVFSKVPTKTPKILVMATSKESVQEITNKRSDPTIRGFDNEQQVKQQTSKTSFWGPDFGQDRNYKFCKFQACTWHSFGHRPTEGTTPHAFEAMQLLDQLANDPGIVAIMKERELVVGTLGEMDPIDDRIMQSKQAEGGNVLGYNTNRGLRIDIKLRSDDLNSFRPYPELVTTLIHELSHNWVSDHNELFWANYAQMRSEYLFQHALLRTGSYYKLVRGQTTVQLAGLTSYFDPKNTAASIKEQVFQIVMQELTKEMAQHGLHPSTIAQPIQQRCDELQTTYESKTEQRLGGSNGNNTAAANGNARELALAAAERRLREQQQHENQPKKG